jgi:hypothetical protein
VYWARRVSGIYEGFGQGYGEAEGKGHMDVAKEKRWDGEGRGLSTKNLARHPDPDTVRAEIAAALLDSQRAVTLPPTSVRRIDTPTDAPLYPPSISNHQHSSTA